MTPLLLMFTVDRLEGDRVVLEDRSARTFDLPREALPRHLREGDRVLLRAVAFPPPAPRADRRRPQGAALAAARRASNREECSSQREEHAND